MENKTLCTLTYTPQNTPNTPAEAKHRLSTFIQRLRRYAKKCGCAPLRCICVADADTEGRSARIHHHVIINFSDADAVTKIWGNGITRLQAITDEQYQRISRRWK